MVAPWQERRYRLFWLLIGLSVGFFAFDELLGFHEAVGNAFDELPPVEALLDRTGFRTLNDVMVIYYGIVAIPLAFFFLPGLLRVPRVMELFIAGFLFYVAHTAIDSLVETSTVLSVICEESMKLFSSCFIALGALTGLRGAVAEIKSGQPTLPAS